MKRPTTLKVAKNGEYTPEQIAAGLKSGKFKQIVMDDKVDLSEGGNFVLVPKSLMEPDITFDSGITVDLPPGGLQHRILDHVSTTPKTFPQGRAFLHRAHHFAVGVEASQQLILLAAERDWLTQYAEFAPHPFDEYTVSLWTGSPNGMVEALVSVMQNPLGEHIACLSSLSWDSGLFNAFSGTAVPREMALRQGAANEHVLAWTFCDAFRLMMAQKKGVTINKGPGNRSALRKGRRVTFYSKNEVLIDLDAVERVRTAVNTGLGRMMPVYQYRAHLCHSGGRKGCEHVWIRDEERPTPFWTCQSCGRKRWHRKSGTRGSAEVGYVRQTYKVVKGKDR